MQLSSSLFFQRLSTPELLVEDHLGAVHLAAVSVAGVPGMCPWQCDRAEVGRPGSGQPGGSGLPAPQARTNRFTIRYPLILSPSKYSTMIMTMTLAMAG